MNKGTMLNMVIGKTALRKRELFLLVSTVVLLVQNGIGAEGKWIRVGMLHNFYQAHGCEPEEDFGSIQQWGLRWPAFYDLQDMQAARGLWFGVKDYDDPVAGLFFPYKVAHVGPRPREEIEEIEMMPVEFKLVANSNHPTVIVDGELASDMEWEDLIDEIDEDLPADRMIYNVIHSSTGITMTRKVYGFSQQYYDNFFIYDYTFKNTGICSKDSAFTHNDRLEGVYIYWQYRNAISAEGTVEGTGINWIGQPGWGTPRDMRWGINTMNDVLGEHPDNPSDNDQLDDNGNIIRCFYSWHGKHSQVPYDNIGSPNWQGYRADGRLGASQYAGVVTLYADKSATEKYDDIYQPRTTMYIESNDPATFSNDQFNQTRTQTEYLDFMAYGHPSKSQAEEVGDGYADQFAGGGGYSQGIGFGPYTLDPGDSIRIVLAEGASGLGRKMNTEVGQNWFEDKKGESVEMILPDSSATTDRNEYKNAWVYTGRDSIIKTFKRAINLFHNNLEMPLPPDPPSSFEVISQGNRILLRWADNAESHPYFEGYKIYRAKGRPDSTYYEILDCNLTDGNLVHEYPDYSAERGQSYYYYIVSYDDGSRNNGVPLRSSLFYTRTNKAATLKKPPAETMDNIRVVPNPYNIRNVNLQYVGEPNKIMFLNLPEKCKIKIFTERGDFIYEIDHEGSGDAKWNLLTSSRQIVVSGVYIATFETPNGEAAIRKFVIIR